MKIEEIRNEIATQIINMEAVIDRMDEIFSARGNQSTPAAKASMTNELNIQKHHLVQCEARLDKIETDGDRYVRVTDTKLGEDCSGILPQHNTDISTICDKLARLDVIDKLGKDVDVTMVVVNFFKLLPIEELVRDDLIPGAPEFVNESFLAFKNPEDAMLYRLSVK
jgi:hypothetical protein